MGPWLVLLVSILPFTDSQKITQCDNGEITNYEKGQTHIGFVLRRGRMSSIYHPNHPYTFQFYVPLTDRDKDCLQVTRDGLVRSLAIKYAIHSINNNSSLNKWGKVGYQLDDVCDDLPTTMARGIEGISYHRPNSVCRDGFLKCDGHMRKSNLTDITRKFIAVVGSGISFTAVPLGSLTSLYDIPHMDFSSTSEALNDREIYQSFFRTVPPDTYQIQVFVEIFRKFQWNYIFLVGSDDDYGKLAVQKLKEITEKTEEGQEKICVVGEEYIPFQSTSRTESQIDIVIEKLKLQSKAKAVVLFTYVKGLGNRFLGKAKANNISRIWLTSEAWNPDALDLPEYLKDQAHGILTVSIPSRSLKEFEEFMYDDVSNNWECNMWLKNYLKNKFYPGKENITVAYNKTNETFMIVNNNIEPKPTQEPEINNVNETNANNTEPHTYKPDMEKISLNDLIDELSRLPAQTENMINAIRALRNGLHYAQEKICTTANNAYCSKLVAPGNVTQEIYNQQYIMENGMKASFRSDGTPNEAVYTISNLIWNGASYEFKKVGEWHNGTKKLNLQRSKIQWPYWLTNKIDYKDEYALADVSKCFRGCIPGEKVINRKGCCWKCQQCENRTVSKVRMASECTPCTIYEHPINSQSKCVKSAQTWLKIEEIEAIIIIGISSLGFLITLVATFYLLSSRKITLHEETSPQILWISCVIVAITFIFGILHIIQPTDIFCPVRSSIFYLLLMMYAAILLVRTKFITKTLLKNSDESLGEKLSTAQLLFILMLFLLELVSVVVWLYVDKERVKISRITLESILLRCAVDLTTAKLASIVIPCVVLLIATFFAFRERNGENYFYEPKFLSFACIALCIIIIAFIPTFIYVKGSYTAFVMVFTMDVFGFTYLACLLLPKCYVTHTRKKFGVDAFKLKPGLEKQKKDEKPKKKKKKQESVSQVTNSTEFNESTKSRSSTKNSMKKSDSVKAPSPSAPPMSDESNNNAIEEAKTTPNDIETNPNTITSPEIAPSDVKLNTQPASEKVVGFTNPAFSSQSEPPAYSEIENECEKSSSTNDVIN